MDRFRRKPFFIKGNFQIAFILGFAVLLLIEVIIAGAAIYRLAGEAIEGAAFSSHIAIQESAQIIRPIIVRVNVYMVLISVLLAGLAVSALYVRLHNLFIKIIAGLHSLRDNDASVRITPYGGKAMRALLAEFNNSASFMDKRLTSLRATLDALASEDNLSQIEILHNRLHRLISGSD